MIKILKIFILSGIFALNPLLSLAKNDEAGHSKKNDISAIDSVVKIFVTSNKMDYYRPWQTKGIRSSGGSGTIIEGNRILTNAHVISEQTFIQVKKNADPKKYIAKVVAVGHDCDLALLEVEDKHFFDGITPMVFGDLPKQQDNVTVIGYPKGGGKISITEGVVSRIEVTSYAQTARQLLTVQIDAAINPGNSGGPVVQDGKLVGIAMQVFNSGQNIGYMIPTIIIDHFFEDLQDGTYEGFPWLGINFRNTESKTLREFYGIENEEGGVFISNILPFSPAVNMLQFGDILLAVNDVPIGEDGTFKFRGEERLSLMYLVTKGQIGEDIQLRIMRDRKIKDIKARLHPFVPLVPQPHYFEKPPYYIFGGIVFTVLSADLTRSWGNRWFEKAPLDLVHYVIGNGRWNKDKRKEIVVLLNVLPDDINTGYHGIHNDIVKAINSVEINSFEGFVLKLHEVEKNEKYTIIETEKKSRIIISNKNIDNINAEILKRNNIPHQFSPDVAQWLNKVK